MAVLMFCPGSDHVSEACALIEALTAWLAAQPAQHLRPMRVEFVKNDDGLLSGITTEPLMELVK